VAWNEPNVLPSYAPTSAIHGLVFTGELASGRARIHSAATGEVIGSVDTASAPSGLAGAPTIVGGMILTGGGTGERGGSDPTDQAYLTSIVNTPVSAFCVEGTPGCTAACPNDAANNACTFEYLLNGVCTSEPGPDTLTCCMHGGRSCDSTDAGVCRSG